MRQGKQPTTAKLTPSSAALSNVTAQIETPQRLGFHEKQLPAYRIIVGKCSVHSLPWAME